MEASPTHSIYPFYYASGKKVLFVAQYGNHVSRSVCSVEQFGDLRNDCQVSQIPLPHPVADLDIHNNDISGGSAWAGLLSNGILRGFAEREYDLNYFTCTRGRNEANQPAVHFYSGPDLSNDYGSDMPFMHRGWICFDPNAPIDDLGLMGSDAIVLNRQVGATEEIHSFYRYGIRTADWWGWPQFPRVYSQITHLRWTGTTWAVEYLNFPGTADFYGIGTLWDVIQDDSLRASVRGTDVPSFGLFLLEVDLTGTNPHVTATYVPTKLPSDDGVWALPPQKIPGISRDLASLQFNKNYGFATAVHKGNTGNGSLNLFYLDEGNIKHVQKMGTGQWIVRPSISANRPDARIDKGGLFTAVATPEGDLHFFGWREDSFLLHAYTRFNADGTPGTWQYENLDTHGLPGPASPRGVPLKTLVIPQPFASIAR